MNEQRQPPAQPPAGICENRHCREVLSSLQIEAVLWAAGEFVPCPAGCGWGQWRTSKGDIVHGSRLAYGLRGQR